MRLPKWLSGAWSAEAPRGNRAKARRRSRRTAETGEFLPQVAHSQLEDRRVLAVSAVVASANVTGALEGQTLALNLASFADDTGNGNTPHTAQIDWGDGSTTAGVITEPNGNTPGSVQGTHKYANEGTYNVLVTVGGPDQSSLAGSLSIGVNNVAPVVQSLSATEITNENGVVKLKGTFSDPGVDDTHTVSIEWAAGDITTLVLLPGERTFSTEHVYRDDNPTGTMQDFQNIRVTVTDSAGESGQRSVSTLVKNVAPTLGAVSVTPSINENGSVTLTGQFTDPGLDDVHSLLINWGPGETAQTVVLPVGARSFSITHQYLDDNPTATAQDLYNIQVTLRDDDLGSSTKSASTTVNNVAPQLETLAATEILNENGIVKLKGSFTDPGTLDTFTLEINWGDGQTSTVILPANDRTFDIDHQYLDDNPTGTSQDVYHIQVRLIDDDLGEALGSVDTLVKNVAPSITAIDVTPMINENGTVTLTGAFTDPRTLDVHTLVINWGPGETLQTIVLPVGQRTFSITHQYRDDNPTATQQDIYNILVTLADDDLRSDSESLSTLVKNVAPQFESLAATEIINENGIVKLKGSFTDPGTLDTFTLQINWGDGQTSTIVIPANERTFDIDHQYLDDNPTGTIQDVYHIQVTLLDDDLGQSLGSVDVLVKNVAPAITAIDVTPMVDENGTVTLTGTFTDPGTLDVHTLVIDWGTGEPLQTVVLPVGQRTFSITHQYRDDNPTGTLQDIYNIQVTLSDDDLGSDTASLTTLVKNVAPTLTSLDATEIINENGIVKLKGSFTDPGTADTFTLQIDWGDGQTSTVVLPANERTFDIDHQYLDDNPTGTSQDVYHIQVTLLDDDLGQTQGSVDVLVKNVAPAITAIDVTPMVDENGTVTLTGTFTDPGTLDVHTLVIDWGTGEPLQTVILPVGQRTFSITHQYRDDNPTGTSQDVYNIQVTLSDDDLGSDTESLTTIVKNVAPVITAIDVTPMIDEHGTVTLTGTFTDPGSLDVHTLVIDWGTGEPLQTVVLPVGQQTFSITHQYRDDDPTGTSQDTYTIQVTLSDDDLGSDTASLTTIVKNVAPTLTSLEATEIINENGIVKLKGSFTDPGMLDTFTLQIDWGDGQTSTIVIPANERTFDIDHQYLDDDPTGTNQDIYHIQVTLLDDDLGQVLGSVDTLVKNVAPEITAIDVTPMVDENGTVTLNGTFTDPGSLDVHTLVIDWGSGEPLQTIVLPAGQRTFSVTHQYLDDNPTGTSQDSYTIQVTLSDDDLGSDTASLTTLVKNVAPTIDAISVTPIVSENGTVTLSGTFTDVGSQDVHTLVINWGTGETPQTIVLPAGQRTFSITHQYLDDNPTATTQDIYTVQVALSDDDLGSDAATLTTTVRNSAPKIAKLTVTSETNENGFVTLRGKFTDAGTRDTHTVVVNWGPGEGQQKLRLAPGVREFTLVHQYLDDNPTGTTQDKIKIVVQVVDDDRGIGTRGVNTRINNVAPVLGDLPEPYQVYEDKLQLPIIVGKFSDVGTRDTHRAMVNWGDGTPPESATIIQAGGQRILAGEHVFPDDGFFTVTVTVFDDDQGIDVGTFVVESRIPTLGFGDSPFFVIRELETGAPGGGPADFYLENQTRDNGASMQRSDPYGSGFRSLQADAAGTREKFYVLRVVHPDGSEGDSIVLPDTELNDIPALLRRLPDNHYRIYQMREDGSRRLVLDVFVVRGRAVDPNDGDRTQDRPPTSQAPQPRRDEVAAAEPLDRRWELWTAREQATKPFTPAVRAIQPTLPAQPPNVVCEEVSTTDESVKTPVAPTEASGANTAALLVSAAAGAAVADYGAWKKQLDQAMERFRPPRPFGRRRATRRSPK